MNSRIRLLLLCILVVFGALLARASWIATVRASSLSRMAEGQATAPIILPAGRGTIFDSMGVPLALGEQATTVYADPRLPWVVCAFAVNAVISSLESIRISQARRDVQLQRLTKIDLASQFTSALLMMCIAW